MARSRVVKVRVTEAEYSDWTEMALRGSVSLSETIRRAMQGNTPYASPKPLESLREAQWAEYNQSIDGTKLLDNAIALLREDDEQGEYGVEVVNIGTTHSAPKVVLSNIRRSEPCSHGKPGFAFCPECDS